ncbi:glutamine amidotransferase [Mycobacterium kyogaense]|uniref:glutamine amidotransferase n=1 Tax=Mycobacterium kyogaense TaxID=2212479 RepID=UPI000DACF43D|nr:glutamine amidotransferase [Mycobacterium kyogaense]
MCGIVGLHLRNPDLTPQLGKLLTGMLGEMADRGTDSAGVAVYGDRIWSPVGAGCVSILEVDAAPTVVADALRVRLGVPVSVQVIDTIFQLTATLDAELLLTAVRAEYPHALVIGFGSDITVLKGIGHPAELARAWGLPAAAGWQGVGHTRMATESAVTASGAHPYAVGPGQCLVHNGSFSNHATIRRSLRTEGVRFDSENDTEVGARFVAAQLAGGRSVETALKELCANFDGFYTLLVSNRDSFAVVRDAIACKPAVIAETPDWVAMASEYRALSDLPGVEAAKIWEPQPEVVYAWNR